MPAGRYKSQLMKFGITRISFVTPNTSTVWRFKSSLMDVTPSDCSIENFVIGRYDGSWPTSVMSVPCRVVMNGSRVFLKDAIICCASMAAMECGMA